MILVGRRIPAEGGGVAATDNVLVEGRLRSAGGRHYLGAQLWSSGPLLARSLPSVLISPRLLQLFLELEADVRCFLGGGVR